MARPKRNIIRQHIVFPEELFTEIEAYLVDPRKGKLRYGALSDITCMLWKQLLREMQKPEVNPADILRRYGVDIGELEAEEEGEIANVSNT